MKIVRIIARGLPLFRQELDIQFYARQRVSENDTESLYHLGSNIYLHTAKAFIGVNASGKTSVLKAIQLAFSIVNNDPINQTEAKTILGGTEKAVFRIFFCDAKTNICCLETEITSYRTKFGERRYAILGEKLWEKPLASVKSKKYLTDFTGLEPLAVRDGTEMFLPEDVSFIIGFNWKKNDGLKFACLFSHTGLNKLPFSGDVPPEIVAFLDPTVEKLCVSRNFIRLKLRGQDEITLNSVPELEKYLSSGTIRGIVALSLVKDVLQSGGYLLIDDIESRLNREIVATLTRFFLDATLNRKGGALLFTTHCPEILDVFSRNDSVYIVRNQNGVIAENLSVALKRNDIKKSEVYQSGFLKGTTLDYDAYLRLKQLFSE